MYSQYPGRGIGHRYVQDKKMTYEKLKSYDFDPNTEILFALELLKLSK